MKSCTILLAFVLLLLVVSCQNKKVEPAPSKAPLAESPILIGEEEVFAEPITAADKWYSRTRIKQKLVELLNSKNPALDHTATISHQHKFTYSHEGVHWIINFRLNENKEVESFLIASGANAEGIPMTVAIEDKDFDGRPNSISGSIKQPNKKGYTEIGWDPDEARSNPQKTKMFMEITKKMIEDFYSLKL